MDTVYTIIHTRDGDSPLGFPTDGWPMGGGLHIMVGGDRQDTVTDTIMDTTMVIHADTVQVIMPDEEGLIRPGLLLMAQPGLLPLTMYIKTVHKV